MLTIPSLLDYYKEHNRVFYLSIKTLLTMKGRCVDRYAEEILSFVHHRYPDNPLKKYEERNNALIEQQQEFESSGIYPSLQPCHTVKSVDREQYNLSLLMSFITTLHRFEILEQFNKFIQHDASSTSSLLSVGAGSGYEVKLALDNIDSSGVYAFENSSDAVTYARDLLDFFHYPCSVLRNEPFPLDKNAGPNKYSSMFDKIIFCEVAEHLEHPDVALSSLKKALTPNGKMFVTMAINIAQEDHIYHYKTAEQARNQILKHDFQILDELLSPVVVLPFEESEREKIFKKGNYIGVLSHKAS